mmetsp:Transcript_14979/g.22442  ORF Transcript_14979/g.22442 Transcript_14979/m.22442 type:complete len:201 (-) Transcript_14979:296-898(-)
MEEALESMACTTKGVSTIHSHNNLNTQIATFLVLPLFKNSTSLLQCSKKISMHSTKLTVSVSPLGDGGTGTRSSISLVVAPAPLVRNIPNAPADPMTMRCIRHMIVSLSVDTMEGVTSTWRFSASVCTNFCTSPSTGTGVPVPLLSSSGSGGGGGASVCIIMTLAFCSLNKQRNTPSEYILISSAASASLFPIPSPVHTI